MTFLPETDNEKIGAYWSILPNKLKTKIIEEMDNNTRLSLRQCSHYSKKLVDSVNNRTIHHVTISEENNFLSLSIAKTEYSATHTVYIATFKSLQKELLGRIKNHWLIEELIFSNFKNEGLMRLSSEGKLLKVGKVSFIESSLCIADIIPQIDPTHLKKIFIKEGIVNPDLFDTPQVRNADLDFECSTRLTDEQLLTLKGNEIRVKSKALTVQGIKKFIQKCLLNLDEHPIEFELTHYWLFNHEIIKGLDIVKTENPDSWNRCYSVHYLASQSEKFQLVLTLGKSYISGKTVFMSRSNFERKPQTNKLRKVERITIDCNPRDEKKGRITVNTKYDKYYGNKGRSHFLSVDKVQANLTYKLNEIDYVKELVIEDTSHYWNFRTANKKYITVGAVVLADSNNVEYFLKQIEPIHLRNITIEGQRKCEEGYSLPQVIHAKKITIESCAIFGLELYNLEAVQLDLKAPENMPAGLNTTMINFLLQRWICELDKKDFNLKMRTPEWRHRQNYCQILEGLPVIHDVENYYQRVSIIDSAFLNYKVLLHLENDELTAKRIEILV